MKPISRREFGAMVAAGVVAGRLPPALASAQAPGFVGMGAAITAAQVIQRIRQNIGVDWREQTVDTIKAGDPDTTVTGIVTTSMATVEVLRQAVAAGANLIITAQSTFFSRADARTPAARGGPPGAAPAAPPPPDPILAAKNELIDGNRIVVFRLSDHWRARQPNPFTEGLAEALGLGAPRPGGEVTVHDFPEVTLERFASLVKSRLDARGGVRAIGRPEARVRSVALLSGTYAITDTLKALPAADVVVAGEIREWESSEYARDVVYSGQNKGLILVGRVVSDEPGMARCARWLQDLVTEVPVRHIAAGDPYWRPA